MYFIRDTSILKMGDTRSDKTEKTKTRHTNVTEGNVITEDYTGMSELQILEKKKEQLLKWYDGKKYGPLEARKAKLYTIIGDGDDEYARLFKKNESTIIKNFNANFYATTIIQHQYYEELCNITTNVEVKTFLDY